MYWMTHADHGTTTAYSTNEKGQLEALGWVLLNEGESPIHPPKVKPVVPETPQMAALNAALSRLSAALGEPALDTVGQHAGVALIDYAAERFAEMSRGGTDDAVDGGGPALTLAESLEEMGAPTKRKYTRKAA